MRHNIKLWIYGRKLSLSGEKWYKAFPDRPIHPWRVDFLSRQLVRP